MSVRPIGEVVDIFCGIGGISHGFKRAGFQVRAGYDFDAQCRHGFEANNDARFIHADISDIEPENIQSRFSGNYPKILVGCAPCQPFSTYQKDKFDNRWHLLTKFARLALEVDPDFITMENVEGLVRYRSGEVFREFLDILGSSYHCNWKVVDCSKIGLAQRRRRLVVIASRQRVIPIEYPAQVDPQTVESAIAHLPALESGGVSTEDPLHRTSRLSQINKDRIQASRPGGTWRDWDASLVAPCHQRKKGKGYASVYGRMRWDLPAPTITTQCYAFGSGRFGHPAQDRAISLREAAILQSFPESYEFFPENQFPGFKTVGKWIGNAVPVKLAEWIATTIIQEIKNEE